MRRFFYVMIAAVGFVGGLAVAALGASLPLTVAGACVVGVVIGVVGGKAVS